jgi:Tfp pilus assembly protein PilV
MSTTHPSRSSGFSHVLIIVIVIFVVILGLLGWRLYTALQSQNADSSEQSAQESSQKAEEELDAFDAELDAIEQDDGMSEIMNAEALY